jgi:BirA family biotin operon repressor/biotin-[acetyl-CoA-carboxylase] ligase
MDVLAAVGTAMQETRARILDALAEGPVGGPDLAERLDISRNAVWKHIDTLRDAGFDIDSGDGGYHLSAVPEYGAPALAFGLEPAFDIECHGSIDSTNRRARELAGEGASDTVVVADKQTGGRGRLDRGWVSPSGGVWLSILQRPDLPPHRVPAFTLAGAVATTRAVREQGVEATIKWPNDVQVEGKKLAGILTEMEGEADRVSWLVVGIGLNANVDVADLPAEQPATSLRAEIGDVNRRELVQRLLAEFAELTANPDSIVPAWRAYATTLGQRVRVDTGREKIVGEAVDIESPGTLVVETDEGRVEVTTGDCEHLRPAD